MAEDVDFDRALAILRQAESGNRSIVGPEVKYSETNIDRPYGYYQIMGKNIPSWTKEVLGKAYTPDEFLADTEAQHKVARAKFTQFAQKHSLQDAYAIWASGRPLSASSENKDLVFGTKVKDIVAARMAQYNKGRTAMADVPNMLEMPRPTIGDVANPSPFYTDAPPAGQDEFNSRYQEALGFLKSPEWKAAALQMAIAAIQPRVPGQSVLGHLANAVGQGAEAAGRVTLQEEGRQLRQSKEQREERELTVREKQVAQTGEYQKESLQLQRERQIQESKQFGLQIKKLEDAEERAKGEDRRKLLQNLGTLYQKALEKEQEALTLATDKEKPTIQKNIQGLQEKLGRVTAVLEKEISTIVPGAFPKAEEKPKAPVVDDVKFNEWLKINPAAVTALKKAGRLSTTPEQDKALADADPSFAAEQDKDRVVPRETKTFWGDVGRAAGSVLSGGTFTNTVELQLRTLDDPRTPENLKQMAKARILSALPSPDAKGEIPKLQLSEWELIFKDKRLSKIMLERLGEEKFNKAKKEFEDRAPRTNTKDARRQREMKAFD